MGDQPDPDGGATAAGSNAAGSEELTGLPGPAFWHAILEAESARTARYRRPATVVLAQIVGFADVSRSWGRLVASRAVVDLGAVLRSGCRASDYVVRLDDGRFGMLLTETDEIAAINLVERLRDECGEAVRTRTVAGRIAFGWASPSATQSLLEAVDRAEDRLRREVGGS